MPGIVLSIQLLGLFLTALGFFGMGKSYVKHQYQECIALGAPQENCIKQILEIK